MSEQPDPPSSASALKLVVVAERLFAERGLDGVSLRQIAAEAGSGNNSAVHYHFGSKEALVAAIFRHRLPRLIADRRLLVARSDPSDLRSRLEAEFLPVLMLAEDPDNRYVSFVEQIQRLDLAEAGHFLELPEEAITSNASFRSDLERLTPHLAGPLRRLRIEETLMMCIHAAARRDRSVAKGSADVSFALFTDSLLDGLAGFLAAPASESTRKRLDS